MYLVCLLHDPSAPCTFCTCHSSSPLCSNNVNGMCNGESSPQIECNNINGGRAPPHPLPQAFGGWPITTAGRAGVCCYRSSTQVVQYWSSRYSNHEVSSSGECSRWSSLYYSAWWFWMLASAIMISVACSCSKRRRVEARRRDMLMQAPLPPVCGVRCHS